MQETRMRLSSVLRLTYSQKACQVVRSVFAPSSAIGSLLVDQKIFADLVWTKPTMPISSITTPPAPRVGYIQKSQGQSQQNASKALTKKKHGLTQKNSVKMEAKMEEVTWHNLKLTPPYIMFSKPLTS